MKRNAMNFLTFALVLGFISLGCASANKSAAKDTKTTQADKSTKTAKAVKADTANAQKTTVADKESAVSKSNMEDKAIDAMIKKYSTSKQAEKGPRIAPDFNLQDINYDTYRLSSYKGRQPVLLFFWHTLCDYCKTEMIMLHNRYPQLVQDGLEVLAIDIGESMDTVSAFIRERGIGFKVLVDSDTLVAASYRTLGVPTYVLVDVNGNIVFQDNIFPDAYKSLLSSEETAR